MVATEVTYTLADERGGEIRVDDLAVLSKVFKDAAEKIGIEVVHGKAEQVELA